MTTQSKEIEEVAEDRVKIQEALDSSALEIKNGFIEDYSITENRIEVIIRSGSEKYRCEEPIARNGKKSDFVEYLEKRLEIDIERPDGLVGKEVKIAENESSSRMLIQSKRELKLIEMGFLQYNPESDGCVTLTPRIFHIIFGSIIASIITEAIAMFVFDSVALTLAVGFLFCMVATVPLLVSGTYRNDTAFEVKTLESN